MDQTKLPASCAKLDLKKAARALKAHDGNISAAAKRLRVPAHDLRLLAQACPELVGAALEAEERRLDEAEAELMACLKSPDTATRLEAASYILRISPAARRRGWGGQPKPEEEAQAVAIKWQDDKA